MKTSILIVSACLAALPALAEEPAAAPAPVTLPDPGYVEFKVNKADFDTLYNFLKKKEYETAGPIIDWMKEQERRARSEAQTDAYKRDSEKPKPHAAPTPDEPKSGPRESR